MKVTQFAKKLGVRFPDIAKQSFDMPSATYSYRAPKFLSTSALNSGEKFHAAFSKFAAGAWIAPHFYYPANAICDALADLGIREIKSEVPVSDGNLNGFVDIVGTTNAGHKVIVELKTTLGNYALEPRTSELFQLASYAHMLGHDNAHLACIRIALSEQRINVYEIDNPDQKIELVRSVIDDTIAA